LNGDGWLASLGPAPQVAAHAVGKLVDLLLSSRQPGLSVDFDEIGMNRQG
jgi:hypothetical protein